MGEFHGNQHTEIEYGSYDYEDLIDDVRSLAIELDTTPTTRDAMKDDALPCLDRIYDVAPGSWQDVLEDAAVGNTQVEQYGPKEKTEMVRDVRRAFTNSRTRVLTTREYDEIGSYPTSVIKSYFGSWSDACQAAGVEPGAKHGTRCGGPLGEVLDSRLELTIAQTLYEKQIEYVVHPRVPETAWTGDFLLPEEDLWIEVNGYQAGDRPNKATFEKKIQHYRDQRMAFEVVSSSEELEHRLRDWGILPA